VPAVLIGGNHAEIERWRKKQSLGRTWQRRPDLLAQVELNEEQQALLAEFIREQHETQSGGSPQAGEDS
jgi:tRNA (guanine37-N1)-methyltransferase